MRSNLLSPDSSRLEELTLARKEFDTHFQKLGERHGGPDQEPLLARVAALRDQTRRIGDALLAERRAGTEVRLLEERFAGELVPTHEELDRAVAALEQATSARLARDIEHAERLFSRTLQRFLLSLSLGLGALVVLAALLVRTLRERRRRHEEAALSETKLSGIISIAADAIIVLDAGQRISIFNRGAEAIFGYRAEEALGQPLSLLLPERFRAPHEAQVWGFSQGPDVARHMGERRAVFGRRKDGEEFPAEAAISRLEVQGHALMTVVLRDVSERERRQREQRFLSQASATLAESLDSRVTTERLVRLCVPEFADGCALYLVQEGHARLVALSDVDPARREALLAAAERSPVPLDSPSGIAHVIRSGQPELLEAVSEERVRALSQADSSYAMLSQVGCCSALAVPLRARGRSIGALAMMVRSSHRVYGPSELALAEELARRSALAIDNARLYAEAQQATRTRDEVLGVVAHDLRNPLNTVVLTARLLQRQLGRAQAGSDTLRGVEAVLDSARRMDRLIQDLLDVVRMEAGTLGVSTSPCSAARLVQDAADAVRALAGDARLRLDIRMEGEPGLVRADPDRMLQVFGNLVGNAIKFTPAGGGITLGVAPREEVVLFWVEDTGPGIPEEQLPRLFERYWQARPEERRGAGLGLSIVKRLVEAHGGRIWARSTPGRGSTFCFTLPRVGGAAAAHQTPGITA
nr:ATP-binding protein [Myxococcus sp. RHSTA-1-4]